MTAGWLASSWHPIAPEAASVGRCECSGLRSSRLLRSGRHRLQQWLTLTSLVKHNRRTDWRNTRMRRGHGVLTGPGKATEKEHPWRTWESQQLSYSSALSLVIRAGLWTYWFPKYALLWLSWSVLTTAAFLLCFSM